MKGIGLTTRSTKKGNVACAKEAFIYNDHLRRDELQNPERGSSQASAPDGRNSYRKKLRRGGRIYSENGRELKKVVNRCPTRT